ncbi:helix-turn-helix domain-containing protein [Embleya sp. NPDC020886]|uniref:GbsR/MarR family transcriptional regulator n=1 Tax=Embleya sp. NPDC020886 TaxID=3363980 RepID=UPI0037B5FD79
MPGGRLTRQERQQIAAGLAEGLSYSGIAKRLERPTSTVVREVMRNAGPLDYRADHAHRATQRRARRGAVAPDSPGRSAAAGYPQDVREFAVRFAALLNNLGIPRMPARVLGCLYTSDSGSLTAAELVLHLRVSPASVSKAVAYLEGQLFVRRERDEELRRDRYVIDDDVWYRALVASVRTNTAVAQAARDGAEILGEQTPAGRRLDDMGVFLDRVVRDLVRSAEHWRSAR